MRLFAMLFLLAAVPLAQAQGRSTQRAQVQAVWGLQQLMQSLAQVREASASFTERDTSPVLSAPLISTGTLTYVAPEYLRKVTISPVPERFVLNHENVTLNGGGGGGVHVFALRQAPGIAGLVEAIRGTLAGNLPALEQFYTVSLTGSRPAWRLRLLPKDRALRRFVRLIVISGSKNQISMIDTASSDGGDSKMLIRADNQLDAP